ncbi:MAG: ABC transporter substrate-binding protein [Candidatus Ozemobacteraceae bacterium]
MRVELPGRSFFARVRLSSLLLASFFLAMGLSGCGSEKNLPERIKQLADSKDLSVIRIGMMEDARDIGPTELHDRSGRFLANLIHAGPLRLNAHGEFVPDLWTRFSVATDPEGNLAIEGDWRDGITWQDRVPVTIDDLRFTIERLSDRQTNSPLSGLARRVKSVEPLNAGKTCRVVFSGTSRQNLHLLGTGLLPAHILRSQKIGGEKIGLQERADGSGIIDGFFVPPVSSGVPQIASAGVSPTEGASSASSAALLPASTESVSVSSSSSLVASQTRIVNFSEFPLGAGPFHIVSRKRHAFLELAAGPFSADETSVASADSSISTKPKRVLIVFYQAPDELVSDLRKGKLEAAYVPSDFAQRLQELKMQGVRLVSSPNPSYHMLGFNTKKAPFNALEVRRAVDHAINRKGLVSLFANAGKILNAPPLGTEDGQAALASRSYDPAKAAEILRSAGYTDKDGDGRLEFEGMPLALTLVTNGDNFLRKQMCDQIADDLKRIGLSVKVDARDWSELISKTLASGTWDLFLLGFQAPTDGNWINLWHSVAEGESVASLDERLNFTGFSTVELDQTLIAIDTLPAPPDLAARKNLVARVLHEQIPGAFLLQSLDVAVVSESLQGFIADGDLWEQDLTTWERLPVPSAGK